MNCWKTINLSRDLGNQRLTIISILIMFFSFVIMYLPLSIYNESIHLNENGLPLLFIGFLLLLPLHTVCQALPARLSSKKLNLEFRFKYKLLPIFRIEYLESISKTLKVSSILSPTLFITLPLIIASIYFPTNMHYFTILAAINIGLSVTDFIYLTHLIKAPKQCQIDQTSDTFDILIREMK